MLNSNINVMGPLLVHRILAHRVDERNLEKVTHKMKGADQEVEQDREGRARGTQERGW